MGFPYLDPANRCGSRVTQQLEQFAVAAAKI
jgi:hypothetical protein